MATAGTVKGGLKTFKLNPKDKVNATVDRKLFEASTSPKGVIKNLPGSKRVEGAAAAAPRAAQAKTANKGDVTPSNASAKQIVESGGNKGGKVDRKA